MDRLKEENFVKNFIKKDKRERLLYELSSPKKREQAIQKIAGSVNDKCIVFSGPTTESRLNSMVAEIIGKNCQFYVISDGEDDGNVLPFDKAFAHLCEWGGAYVLLCGTTVAVVKEEYVAGPFFATVLKS